MARVRVNVCLTCNSVHAHEGNLKKAVRTAWCAHPEAPAGEISVALVPPNLMRELNRSYKNKDSVTDVLAFPVTDEIGRSRGLLGEVVICPEVAALQAEERGHSIAEELTLLAVHGALHLLGYRDETDRERREMKSCEKHILHLLGQDECTAD